MIMVEKNSLTSLSQSVDLKESRRGVLKPSDSPSKGTTAEEQEEQMALDESRMSSSSSNEVDTFNNLCDGVLTAHSMFDMCLTEILAIKDELVKHSLPSNLLINLTLACSKLYRSANDLCIPTNELIRLVRLYSAKWEAKSNVLRKLHEDHESKQRRLDIALKKLELVGVTSERIEKEKRIINWEKIFSKVMTSKSHGHRWKFLINSLKEKVKSGEILSIPFPSNTNDDAPGDDTKAETYIPRHHRRNVKSLKHESLLRREARNSRGSRTSDEQQEDREVESELSSEEDLHNVEKHATDAMTKNVNKSEARLSFTSSRFKSKYPFEGEEFPRRFKTERTETPTGIRSIRNSPRATTPVRRLIPRNSDVSKKNVSFFEEISKTTQPLVCVKEDKSVWTGEAQYDRFLHVRVYKPVCTRAPEPICTVCFGDQVFSGSVYETNEDVSGSTENNATISHEDDAIKSSEASLENIKFQEFVFPLPDENVFVKGKPVQGIASEQLRIAVQPGKGEQMVAMSTVEYSDLKIPGEISEEEDLLINTIENYSLLSLLSDKQTMFNSVVGHVPLVSYQTKKERALSRDQSTQTLCIQELFDEIMEIKRIEEEKNKLKDDEPVKMFSETEFRAMEQKHAEELECLRTEYEMQLEEIIRKSDSNSERLSPHQLEPKFVSACTSPISMELISPSASSPRTPAGRPRTADARSSPRRGKKIKTSQNLPEWGKDLPANFLDRLDQFSRASAKHHQELSEKTKKAVQENYELQMATQNRLDLTDDNIDLNDVCLPALFMPSRMGTVYSPKASLYFHPSDVSKSRFTQPPSVFKLPYATEQDRSSVMNLFNLSQTFHSSGPTWLHQNGRPPSASSAVPQKKNRSMSTSLNTHEAERYAKLKSE